MNESLRWKLVLGCLVLAVIELPHDAELLAHDLQGPYCAGPSPSVHAAAVPLARTLHASDADEWQMAVHDDAVQGADVEALLDDPFESIASDVERD